MRICPRDGFEMTLDVETARRAVDAGYPPIELYTCRNAHSHRDWPEAAVHPERSQGARPCAWCGGPLPPLKGAGLGSRKYHVGACTANASRERGLWCWYHPAEPFVLERAPWYRGPLAPTEPLPPLDPLAGRMPRDWADGWLRSYGVATLEPAA